MKHVTALLAALLLVLGSHTLIRADAPPGVEKWEYKVEPLNHSEPKDFDARGQEGWEAVAVEGTVHYFKRPKK